MHGSAGGSLEKKDYLRARVTYPEPGLVEVVIENRGRSAAILPASVTAVWEVAGFVGGDGVKGYNGRKDGDLFRFQINPGARTERLSPGQTRRVGWIRLDMECEVRASVD